MESSVREMASWMASSVSQGKRFSWLLMKVADVSANVKSLRMNWGTVATNSDRVGVKAPFS